MTNRGVAKGSVPAGGRTMPDSPRCVMRLLSLKKIRVCLHYQSFDWFVGVVFRRTGKLRRLCVYALPCWHVNIEWIRS